MHDNILGKRLCEQCRDALRCVQHAIHSLNNKTTVIGGTAEYASRDNGIADDSKRMLALTEVAIQEYKKELLPACEILDKTIKEIEWCLKQREEGER